MNELGISLLWLAGQVTLLCIAIAAIYLVARRRHPTAGATAALSGLLLCALLTLGAFSPWPRWSLHSETHATNEPVTSTSDGNATYDTSTVTNQVRDGAAAREATPAVDEELETTSTPAWTVFWRSLGREFTRPTPQSTESGYRWTAWLAVSILLAITLGAVRLLAGWLAVQRCLKRSTLIDEDPLTQTLDVLCAELGERRTVPLRESNEITSAATIGWRRPVILLPRGWRDWSQDQQRIVLAHELAHVNASDAATWLAAQVGLLLHFYHPLVHWLAHRLRLEQELAADAVAARLTGSPQSYLASLAELAVRQPDRRLAWPARAFLPTRGTLLRRIEMLRDTKTLPLRSSTLRRASVIGLTLAAGVFVAGLRPPGGEEALAQQTAKPQAVQASAEDKATSGFNLESVPGSTKVLIGLRPAQIASRPEMTPLVKVINELIEADKTDIRFEDIDQVLMIVAGPVVLDAGARLFRGPVVEVRMTEPTDFTAFAKNQDLITNDGGRGLNTDPDAPPLTVKQRKDIRESDVFRLQFLTAIREEDTEGVMDIVDERTMRYGLGKDLWALLDDLDRISVGRPDWAETFEKVADGHACIVGDVAAFRSFFETQFQGQPSPIAGLFVPLWKNTNLAIGSVRFDDKLPITVHAWAGDADAAATLEQTLLALVPLGRGMLESAKVSLPQQPEDLRTMLEQAIAVGESALDNLKVQPEEDHVTLTVTADGGVAPLTTLVSTFVPAIQQAREAARRTQAGNALKQIGLALNNYNDVHGHFPAPLVYGRNADGKSEHPHSWRVALLPFLDQAELYDSYHFDEPWDSEHNKSILAKMPPVFGHPGDDDSTSAAYYCLVGEHTGLGNRPEPGQKPGGTGVRIQDITDGTSSTILLVEAKRDIPWTKPEDIPYSPDEDLPDLGGHWDPRANGFYICLADGAVRFVSKAIDEATLRNLITRDDGNALPVGPDR